MPKAPDLKTNPAKQTARKATKTCLNPRVRETMKEVKELARELNRNLRTRWSDLVETSE